MYFLDPCAIIFLTIFMKPNVMRHLLVRIGTCYFLLREEPIGRGKNQGRDEDLKSSKIHVRL